MNLQTDALPITQKDFTEVMNVMAEVFPAINGKARIRLYWQAVNRLPLKALKEISQSFLMGGRHMPTPQDFHEAAKDWKRKNDWTVTEVEAQVSICQYCRNSGVVRIVHLSNSEIDHLMRCNCFESWRSENMKFPQFDYALKQVYKIGPCPLEWFKPNDKNLNGKEFEKLQLKYFSKIKNAEKYLSDLVFKN